MKKEDLMSQCLKTKENERGRQKSTENDNQVPAMQFMTNLEYYQNTQEEVGWHTCSWTAACFKLSLSLSRYVPFVAGMAGEFEPEPFFNFRVKGNAYSSGSSSSLLFPWVSNSVQSYQKAKKDTYGSFHAI